MLFDTVCIWGWPLHSHTHSYIHNGFFRAAQHLGLRAVWLDNVQGAGDWLPPNTLFITETQVDSHIPLRQDCFYALHNCDAEKYRGMRTMSIQCLITSARGEPFLGKPWLLRDGAGLFMPWATDLLPPEIDEHAARLETLWAQRGPDAAFVGYFIQDPWVRAEAHLKTRGVSLSKCGGFGLRNVSVDENVRRIQGSRIAPALQSEEQVQRGYLPCRILKNISYGALGITNNPAVERLFGPELFSKLIVGSSIEDALDKGLAASMDFAVQRELMAHIRDNHTFVNRLQEVEAVLRTLGFTRTEPARPQQLNVVHLTFHAGCESDLEAVGQALGWNLKSIMLLREPDASNEWYTMTDAIVSMLWTRFQALLEAADLVVVSDTAPLARIFVKHPVKQLIVWVCNRINYGCSVGFHHDEVRNLSQEPWVRYVAYTPFEVQFAPRPGFQVKWHGTVRPLGRVVPPSEHDHSREVFVGAYHNDAIALDLRALIEPHVRAAGLTIAPQTRYAGSAELQRFAAVVHVPYAASNLALFEALANGIPYLIPSQRLMQRMIDRTEPLPYREALFVPDRNASAIEWFRFADLFLTFDRFEDIPSLLQSNALATCRQRLRERYAVHAEQTLAQWRQLTQKGDPFAVMAPLLRVAFKPYVADEVFRHFFKRVPLGRDVTFAAVIQSLRTLGREPEILELGTSRSFVDGMFPGCNTDDVSVWEPHVMDRWDWSAGCFTKVMATVFPKAHIVTVDVCRAHLERCRIMTQDSSQNIEFVQKSSVHFLQTVQQRFDLVYVDTGDMTPIESTAALQLAEAEHIDRVLMPNGMLLIDDVRSVVPLQAGHTDPFGKAFRSLPWLLAHGFHVCMDEYQTLLRRKALN